MAHTVKKILFLRSAQRKETDVSRDWGSLKSGVGGNLGKNYQVTVSLLSELAFLVDGENSRIWSPQHGWDIADFDLVVFRLVGEELEKAIAAAHYLNGKGVLFIDTYLLARGKGKLAGAFLRNAENLPAPKTLYAEPAVLKAILSKEKTLEYPFVLKADGGRKGRDNYLIKSFAELDKKLKASKYLRMLAQEYIPNDGDMRILVLAGKARLIILRKAVEGTHLNNTSMGGAAELIDIASLPQNILRDCERAAKLEQLQVAGVDVMIDKETGRHYIIEVNRAPQLATGAFVDSKIAAYANMLDEIVKANVVHTKQPTRLTHIGRVERISFPDISRKTILAKVDTGADSSSVAAKDIHENESGLTATIMGEKLHFKPSQYSIIRVENSFGQRETRYKVKLTVKLKGRTVKGAFTLSNRSRKTYKVLLGRRLLAGKFLVNVMAGNPLVVEERRRSQAIQAELKKRNLV